MEYCCHIWAGAPASTLAMLDRIQKRVTNLVGPALASQLQPLSHRRLVASLSLYYKYFHGRCCSTELSQLVPPLKIFNRSTRLAARSHPYTVVLPKSNRNFYKTSFFPRTSALWNTLLYCCFPDEYDLHSFKKM